MSKFYSVQKLLQFQVLKFGKISYKFADKNEISRYLTQYVSRPSIISSIFQRIPLNSLFSFMLQSSGKNFSFFQPKLKDLIRFAWDILIFHFSLPILKRSYQISEITIAITNRFEFWHPVKLHLCRVIFRIIATAFFGTCLIFVCFTLASLWAPSRSWLYLGGKWGWSLSFMWLNLICHFYVSCPYLYDKWQMTLFWFVCLLHQRNLILIGLSGAFEIILMHLHDVREP